MIDIDALVPAPESIRWRGTVYELRKGIPLSVMRAATSDDVSDVDAALIAVANALGVTVAHLEEMDPTDNELMALQAAISSATETDDLGGSSASSDSLPVGDGR